MTFDMTFDEFVRVSGLLHSFHPEWRDGQRLFNLLREANEPCAAKLAGTGADPFHHDERIPAAWQFIAAHWDDQ